MGLWSHRGETTPRAEGESKANASGKDRSLRRSSAAIGGFAAIALTRPRSPVVQRPVRSGVEAAVLSIRLESSRRHACLVPVRIHQLKAVGGLRAIYSCFADAPGAEAALAPAAVPFPLAGAGFMPAGLGDADLFGLNKRGNLNLRGVGDGTGVGVGLGDASATAFLRLRFGCGEAAGDSAAEGDAALSAGEVASVFLGVRCFGGEGDSLGGVPVSSCD